MGGDSPFSSDERSYGHTATTTVSSGLPTSRKRVANRRGGLWGGV